MKDFDNEMVIPLTQMRRRGRPPESKNTIIWLGVFTLCVTKDDQICKCLILRIAQEVRRPES